jgi:hypothetical protein
MSVSLDRLETPDVVALAGEAKTKNRHELLAELIDRALGHSWKSFESGDFSALASTGSKAGQAKSEGATIAASEKTWLPMVGHSDAKVRAAAFMLVALVATKPEKSAVLVATALKKEKDETTRATALVALGVLDARGGTDRDAEVLREATGEFADNQKLRPSPLITTAATLGLGYAKPFAVTKWLLQQLRKNGAVSAPSTQLPIYGGKLGALGKKRLATLEAIDVHAWENEIDRLIVEHPRKRTKTSNTVEHDGIVITAWTVLTDRMFGKLGGRKDDELLLGELSDDQRKILVFGYSRLLPSRLNAYGVGFLDSKVDPTKSRGTNWSMGRFLGTTPPGALDAEVTILGETAPWWKFFLRLARKQLAPGPIEKALGAMTEGELIALAADLTEFAYEPTWREGTLDRSARAEVVLRVLTARGLNSPKHEPVRVVLQAMAVGNLTPLRKQGWFVGPFVPRKRSK